MASPVEEKRKDDFSPSSVQDDAVPKEGDFPAYPSSDEKEDEDLETVYRVNEKALLRKLDFRLLPAVTLLYLLSFLDRSNGERDSTAFATIPIPFRI